jgi:putative nucleotidyltransferase with HDIG domain
MNKQSKTSGHIIGEIVEKEVIEAIGDGVSILDADLKILYQNQAHKDLFGDHTGQRCHEAYKCSNGSHVCPLELSLKTNKTSRAERKIQTNGSTLHVDITASPIRNRDGGIMGGIEVFKDITGRKKSETRTRLVYEFTQRVNKRLDIAYRLHEICTTVVQLGYRMVWVGLLNDETKDVIPGAQAGFESGYLSSVRVKYDDSPLGQGPTGRAIKIKEPSLQNHITTDPRYRPWREHAVQRGYRSSAAFPIIEENEVVGVLNVYSSSDAFPDTEVDFLQSFANLSASYIKISQLLTGMNDLFLGTVNALSETISAKSGWTRGHSDRVVRLSVDIGREIGLTEKDLSSLELASILHDIGKIATFESILNKPEELTEKEFDLVKQHADKGAEIITTIKQLKEIVPVIKHHHERYDGGGYPDGLKGDGIPLMARILCVADSVDSMLEDRPYRKGREMEEIIKELEHGSGTQFDPEVVRAFLKTL